MWERNNGKGISIYMKREYDNERHIVEDGFQISKIRLFWWVLRAMENSGHKKFSISLQRE